MGIDEQGVPPLGHRLDWRYIAKSLLKAYAQAQTLSNPLRKELMANHPLIIEKLREKKLDSLLYANLSSPPPWQCLYNKVWKLQEKNLKKILIKFREGNIKTIIFKGAECLLRDRSLSPIGLMSDSDILVEKHKIVDAMAILYSEGYTPSIFNGKSWIHERRPLANIAAIESAHYQLPPFSRCFPIYLSPKEKDCAAQYSKDPVWHSAEHGSRFVMELDVHHSLASDIDISSFIERSRKGDLAYFLDDADHLWFLCCRFYNEVALHNKRTMRDLVYIISALRSIKHALQWNRIYALCKEYDSFPSLYYILSFCRHLNENLVPIRCLEELRPDTHGSRARDFGWLLGVLFDDIEPPPFLR